MKWPHEANDVANCGFVFSVANTNFHLKGGDMQGGIGMAGNRISNLGALEHQNDAVHLCFVNEDFLKRDGSNWMRDNLDQGGFRIRGMANPRDKQDAVNLQTLKKSEMGVLRQAADAVGTAVNDAILNHRIAV